MTARALAAVLCLALAGCATSGREPGDPLEGYNRFMFKVDDSLDRAVIEPTARGYHNVVPEFVRTAFRNFLHNLRSPVNAANNVLQGDIKGAAADVSRFGMNTVIGVGGLFDVAAETGLKYERTDFGQTLGVWGVGPGPYLVLPVLGPSDVRDTTGLVADSVGDPVNLYLFNVHEQGWAYARGVATGLDKREELLSAIDDLRRNSLDYYAATRSAYLQERQSLVDSKKWGKTASAGPAIPDYDPPHP